MTAVYLFVMLMYNMGPDKQDQTSVLCIRFFIQELKKSKSTEDGKINSADRVKYTYY